MIGTALNRRHFLRNVFSASAGVALTERLHGLAGATARRPNIVFILADDMGYGDTSAYGQKKFKTPNIDRLAAEGVRFAQAYAGAPVCAPSRSTLMTGLNTGHTRVRDNFALAGGHVGHKGKEEIRRASLTEADRTVADYLSQKGYKTALFSDRAALARTSPLSAFSKKKYLSEMFCGLAMLFCRSHSRAVLVSSCRFASPVTI